MADYKDTLNLPTTDFPMRGNLPQREPNMLQFWQEIDIYNQLLMRNQGKPTFTLHDGPPYANGAIHVGHAMNKILKDMIIKSRWLLGFDCAYVPGWDCHGLPIEQKVEQKLGKPSEKLSASAFRAACRAFASEQVALQKPDFMRLGVFADWENPYLTMDFANEAAIVRALREIVAKNHVVKGFKPINWCFDCGSSLAEAEVEYQQKTSHSIDVSFAVKTPDELWNRLGIAPLDAAVDVVIWTTTPWTLPANVAVALHPDIEYGLFVADERWVIVAAELVESIKARWQSEKAWQELARVSGKALEGLKLLHPFAEREVPIINGEHVTLEAGTGCVHTAPAHGVEDYEVCKAYHIEMINVLLGNGVFSQEADLVAGLPMKQAEALILETLKTSGRLLQHSRFEHSYPHCWRHKTPTVFRATTQWFISMDKAALREKALADLENVSFTPAWGKARLVNMIAGRPDWCISRQRYWGVPLCFVAHKETGELHPDILAIMDKAAEQIAKEGIEAWFELPLEALIPKEDVEYYEKLNDVLDVWFDSGVTHYSVLRGRQRLSYPADLYLEGSDQHRGWFHSSLLTGAAIDGRAPYKALLTHGFTVDEQGRKMSKSLGNVVEPKKVISQMGADVLRLWVASSDYSAEVSLSENILKQRADAYRRIRNTCRFLLANLHDFDPNVHLVEKEQMLALDRYAVASAHALQEKLIEDYQRYEFHNIYQRLFNYCAVELGGFYLDVIKDRQYTVATDNLARRSAQTAMYHVLEAMVRWLAPICSFTAEEIWQHMPARAEKSVFFSQFYEQLFALTEADLPQAFWQLLMKCRDTVNAALEKARKEGVIGGSLEADIVLTVAPEDYAWLSKLGEELRFALIVSKVRLQAGDAAEGISVVVEKSGAQKCERCWHFVESVGQNPEHPHLCQRCVENISGAGEVRHYV